MYEKDWMFSNNKGSDNIPFLVNTKDKEFFFLLLPRFVEIGMMHI